MLRLFYERRIGTPYGSPCTKSDENGSRLSYHHVWLAVGELSVDVNGVHDRQTFSEDMRTKYDCIAEAKPETIQRIIDEKRFTPKLLKRVNDRALWVFDNETRFDPIRRLIADYPSVDTNRNRAV